MFDSLGLFDEISHCAWFNIRKYNHLPHDSKEGAQIFFFLFISFLFLSIQKKGQFKKRKGVWLYKKMNSPSNIWSLQQLFGFLDQNKDGIIDLHDIIAVCNSPNAHVDQVT